MNQTRAADTDIVLVGAGIMSATLAVFLKELEPSLRIEIFETLEGAALESSDAWNNAGTGHAALCELNYTPQRSDGSIDISKALAVNVEFDLSRQFWSYLIRKRALGSPDLFIHAVPHMSFVHGAAHVAYLKKRYAALTAHHLYRGMEFTEDKQTLRDWFPLVMEGRPDSDIIAATRMITGADVNYGALTRNLIGICRRSAASPFTIRVASPGCTARTAAAGASKRSIRPTTRKHRPRQNSSFSAPAAAPCRSCRNRGFRKRTVTPASRSAAFGCAATTQPSTNGITPKSTAWPMSVRRRCPFLTSIPGSSAILIRFYLGPMPVSPPSS
jgi:Malate:quinone oxidoreductase (Mqo)